MRTSKSHPKIIVVRGPSGSGKTSLIEKLIPALKERGYRVGTVKHTSHGYCLDKKGKDSWRHSRAGAEVVVLSGPSSHAVMMSDEVAGLGKLVKMYLSELDIVISEGYGKEERPRITLSSPASKLRFSYRRGKKWKVKLFGRDEVPLLVDLIQSELLKSKR